MSITMSTFAHPFSFDMDGSNDINKPNHCHFALFGLHKKKVDVIWKRGEKKDDRNPVAQMRLLPFRSLCRCLFAEWTAIELQDRAHSSGNQTSFRMAYFLSKFICKCAKKESVWCPTIISWEPIEHVLKICNGGWIFVQFNNKLHCLKWHQCNEAVTLTKN